jgi:hypothetical protein
VAVELAEELEAASVMAVELEAASEVMAVELVAASEVMEVELVVESEVMEVELEVALVVELEVALVVAMAVVAVVSLVALDRLDRLPATGLQEAAVRIKREDVFRLIATMDEWVHNFQTTVAKNDVSVYETREARSRRLKSTFMSTCPFSRTFSSFVIVDKPKVINRND